MVTSGFAGHAFHSHAVRKHANNSWMSVVMHAFQNESMPTFSKSCNALICLQLAVHRAPSCGTHRVVTHSRKMRFSAHRTSAASPTLHKQQRRSLRTESTTTQPPPADAGLCIATAVSFRPSQQQNTFCSVSLLTRAVVV